MAELKRIKQAIRDGRLWEHLEMRAHAHPALFTALKKMKSHEDFIEKYSPTVKKSGLFFFSHVGLARPEVVHYRNRLLERYSPPEEARVLLLMPQTRHKPFHKTQQFKKIRHVLQQLDKATVSHVHVCVYAAPFGLIPLELDETYPLSQHETSLPHDRETVDYVATQVAEYIQRTHYKTVVLLHDPQQWGTSVKKSCKNACKKKSITFEYVSIKAEGTKNILTRLQMILTKHSSD